MPADLHGLPISTASPEAAAAFERTLLAYFKYRVDTPKHLAAALEADEDFALAQVLRGYFLLLAFNQNQVAAAAEAARAAKKSIARATEREKQHLGALECWIAGDLDRTIAIWEEILAEHPRDVLAFRLAHFNNFWLGRPEAMRASVDRVEPHWGRALPGYGTLLACKCFAYEECGEYASAEPAGRSAVEIDAEREGIRVSGFAGLPTFNRGSAQHQYLFVNGRPVRDRLLHGAVRGAYQDLLASDRHPAVALFLELPAELVDVNVHPMKNEVRFRDAGSVRGLIVPIRKHNLAMH